MGYVEAIYRGPNERVKTREKLQPKLRFLSEKELRPFDLNVVTNLLDLYIPFPKSAMKYDASHDTPEPNQKNAAFLPRPRKEIEDGPLKNLLALLKTIVEAQFKKVNLQDIKSSLNAKSIQEIYFHQGSLSRQEYAHFVSLIGYWYSELHQEALIERKDIRNPLYHHPTRGKDPDRTKEMIHQQLATFTEVNVNSWAVTDDEDPSIVYTSKGGATLLSSRHDLPFDQRKVLDLPDHAPRAYQPGYDELLTAFDCMSKETALEKRRYEEWVAFGDAQIRALEDTHLGSDVIEIPRSRSRAWRVPFRLGDDPKQAASKTLMDSNLRNPTHKQFAEILNGLTHLLEEEYKQTGSDYWKLQTWKMDLKLRELRGEISNKLQKRWRFILQQVPSKEFGIQGSRCAHPTCKYHEDESIPSESFRLNFVDPEGRTEEQVYFLDETSKDDPKTPGRAPNGQMWFCLPCVENLFDGEGLISRIGSEKISAKTSSENTHMSITLAKVNPAWEDRRNNSIANAVTRSPVPLPKTRKRKNADLGSQNSVSESQEFRGDTSSSPKRTAQKKESAPSGSSRPIPYRPAQIAGPRILPAVDLVQVVDEDKNVITKPDEIFNGEFLHVDDDVEAPHVMVPNIISEGGQTMTKADKTKAIETKSASSEFSIAHPKFDNHTPQIVGPSESHPAVMYPVPPRLFRRAPLLGITPFTSALSTFIDPEIRYTVSECYTLSPQAYFGLHMWKDLATRLAPWLCLANKNGAGSSFDLDDEDFLDRNGILTDLRGPNVIGSREIDGQKLTMSDCIIRPQHDSRNRVLSSKDYVKLKSLSQIMALIDSRNSKPADAGPRKDFLTIAEREWPLHSFWETEFEAERKRIEGVSLAEKIKENQKIISDMKKKFRETEKAEKDRRRKQKEVIKSLEAEAAEFEASQKFAGQLGEMSVVERIKKNQEIIEQLQKEAEEEECCEDEEVEEEEIVVWHGD